MSLSTSVRMKIWYDDAAGVPVDITRQVLTINDVDIQGMVEMTRPFGVAMDEFTPTGIGTMPPIELGGLLKTATVGSLDDLFGDRVPEDPDTPTRTLKIDWVGGDTRVTQVETYLKGYKKTSNRDNGLTRVLISLQPTGDVIEYGAT